MNSIRLIALLLSGVGLLGPAVAGDVYVIAHPSVSLSADDVRSVFVGDKQLAGSVKLSPMDNSSAQADFLAKVLKVDANKYAAIWTKKGFRDGMTAPPLRNGDAEVLQLVKSTPGAIGYVSKTGPDVTVIQKY